MKKKISEYSFLFISFFLGWFSLYGNVLSFLLIPLIIVNILADFSSFVKNLKQGKWYLGVPCMFVCYMIFHTLIVNLFGVYEGLKASYGIFETLLLYFITIPLYILSVKPFMTPTLLKKALCLFIGGVLLFNVVTFFHLTGWELFRNPVETLNFVYNSRFGGNKSALLGGDLMLEPQAVVVALASFISYSLFFIKRKWWLAGTTLLLIMILSFTVTKSSILAFLLGAIVSTVYVLKKMQMRQRVYTLFAIMLMTGTAIFLMPQGIENRIHEVAVEVENIKIGKAEGGSLIPRLAMWKEAYKHLDEYAICGMGVYYKPKLQEWYTTPDNTFKFTNVHNSFLEYWIRGGIFGLALLVSLFAFPCLRMKSLRQWPSLVLGGCLVVFAASNTCVLFVHVYSLGVILFWLSAFYFYVKDFNALEREL